MIKSTISYIPSKELLEKYAKVLINFALNSGQGIKKGDVVYLQIAESAKPFYIAIRNEILKAGGTYITNYLPDDVSRGFFELANEEQLSTFHDKYYKGLIDQIDHSIYIVSETNKRELEGIDPKKIMLRSKSTKPYMEWRDEKENKGKFTWTIALYGTEAMAKEANLTLKEYWEQIIKACYLDEKDPVDKWRQVFAELDRVKSKLNSLKIEKLHIEAEKIDLFVGIGKNRQWLGGMGRNIPSFELFISPDCHQTSGYVSFNQPLYRYGSLIEGVRLEFKNGLITKATATKNEKLLAEMIKTDQGSDKIGEFSLTDSRLSKITKFMAETLFDENMGGPYGNMHIAIGKAYKDSYPKNPAKVDKKTWENMGYNDSIVHTDIINTEKKTVTAHLESGEKKVIYKDGKFLV